MAAGQCRSKHASWEGGQWVGGQQEGSGCGGVRGEGERALNTGVPREYASLGRRNIWVGEVGGFKDVGVQVEASTSSEACRGFPPSGGLGLLRRCRTETGYVVLLTQLLGQGEEILTGHLFRALCIQRAALLVILSG